VVGIVVRVRGVVVEDLVRRDPVPVEKIVVVCPLVAVVVVVVVVVIFIVVICVSGVIVVIVVITIVVVAIVVIFVGYLVVVPARIPVVVAFVLRVRLELLLAVEGISQPQGELGNRARNPNDRLKHTSRKAAQESGNESPFAVFLVFVKGARDDAVSSAAQGIEQNLHALDSAFADVAGLVRVAADFLLVRLPRGAP